MKMSKGRILITLASSASVMLSLVGAGSRWRARGEGTGEGDARRRSSSRARPIRSCSIRSLVSDGESLPRHDADLRGSRRASSRARRASGPGLATSWKRRQERQGLDVQPPHGRQVPRRHAVQRRRRSAPTSTAGTTSRARSRTPSATYYWQAVFGGFQHNESHVARPQPVQELQGEGQLQGSDHADEAVGPFLGALVAADFAIAEPDRAEEVRREPGHDHANGVFRRPARTVSQHPTGTGPFKFEVVDGRRRLVLDRERRLLGHEGEAEADHLPADRRQRGPRCRRCRPVRSTGYDLVAAAGHRDDRRTTRT